MKTDYFAENVLVSILAVYHALTKPGSLILVLSPSARQSGEFVLKAAEWLGPLKIKVRRDGVNEHSIVFPNGSRMVGLPEESWLTRVRAKIGLS